MRRLLMVIACLVVTAGLVLIAGVFIYRDRGTAQPVAAWTRPSATASATASASPSVSASPKAAVVHFAFPIVGHASYAHEHHDYPAADIMANCGLPVVSPVDGVVLELTRVDTWTAKVNAGATRGGLSWSILGDDGARYYGSHMSVINKEIQPGVRVKAGQALGKVGETGDAGACHLHFGISPVCARTADWWTRRGVIWPWPFLDAWRKGQNKSAFATVAAWQKQHGCPTKPLVDP